MTKQIKIPKIGTAMVEGILTEWLVADGDTVAEGTAIYSLETDKATNEIEAPVGGIIRLLGEEGETYEVGTVIAELN
ncbi:biotin/lipoyl-containing protein [Parasphingorhabdus sp.]|uniref:biotin/lipoyl-containing protein n=1 Tax=Parasphingorhabdus sp. TaxID=2709688 RepID=UPI003A922283